MQSRQLATSDATEQAQWPLVIAVSVAMVAGAALALIMIPTWVPILGASLVGAEPKAYWYLSRASALAAFVLLWVSMASGLIISNKLARIWPGAFTAFDLHQFTSLLGLGFAVLHVLTLLGDRYIGYSLVQVLVPFANAPYRPLWVALGQVALYLSYRSPQLCKFRLEIFVCRRFGCRPTYFEFHVGLTRSEMQAQHVEVALGSCRVHPAYPLTCTSGRVSRGAAVPLPEAVLGCGRDPAPAVPPPAAVARQEPASLAGRLDLGFPVRGRAGPTPGRSAACCLPRLSGGGGGMVVGAHVFSPSPSRCHVHSDSTRA